MKCKICEKPIHPNLEHEHFRDEEQESGQVVVQEASGGSAWIEVDVETVTHERMRTALLSFAEVIRLRNLLDSIIEKRA